MKEKDYIALHTVDIKGQMMHEIQVFIVILNIL